MTFSSPFVVSPEELRRYVMKHLLLLLGVLTPPPNEEKFHVASPELTEEHFRRSVITSEVKRGGGEYIRGGGGRV